MKTRLTIFGIGAGKDGQNIVDFSNVKNIELKDNLLCFDYISASTGIERCATFNLNQISGYALNNSNTEVSNEYNDEFLNEQIKGIEEFQKTLGENDTEKYQELEDRKQGFIKLKDFFKGTN